MAITGKNGVTANTPKHIQFGAGTIHKSLAYETPVYTLTSDTAIVSGKTYYTRSGSSPDYVYAPVASPVVSNITNYYEITSGGWNFDTSIIGATSGGSKITITPEVTAVEVDGALVAVKGLKVKTGEVATMEINFIELSSEILKAATLGTDGTSSDVIYDLIESKSSIATGDYFTNLAFVGKTLEGQNIIVIMDNAICTSGMELEGKNKEAGVVALTFECTAELTSDLDRLPWHIYYPTPTI